MKATVKTLFFRKNKPLNHHLIFNFPEKKHILELQIFGVQYRNVLKSDYSTDSCAFADSCPFTHMFAFRDNCAFRILTKT